jgi:hypothetical protein
VPEGYHATHSTGARGWEQIELDAPMEFLEKRLGSVRFAQAENRAMVADSRRARSSLHALARSGGRGLGSDGASAALAGLAVSLCELSRLMSSEACDDGRRLRARSGAGLIFRCDCSNWLTISPAPVRKVFGGPRPYTLLYALASWNFTALGPHSWCIQSEITEKWHAFILHAQERKPKVLASMGRRCTN